MSCTNFVNAFSKNVALCIEKSDDKIQHVYNTFGISDVVVCSSKECDEYLIKFIRGCDRNGEDNFNYSECDICRNPICSKCWNDCYYCGYDVCPNCLVTCDSCNSNKTCLKCSSECQTCCKTFCPECIGKCGKCHYLKCKTCIQRCHSCSRYVCKCVIINDEGCNYCTRNCCVCDNLVNENKIYNIKIGENLEQITYACKKDCIVEYLNNHKTPHLKCKYEGYMEAVNNSYIRCGNINCKEHTEWE